MNRHSWRQCTPLHVQNRQAYVSVKCVRQCYNILRTARISPSAISSLWANEEAIQGRRSQLDSISCAIGFTRMTRNSTRKESRAWWHKGLYRSLFIVTVTRWYRTRRPVHYYHFWYITCPYLSSNNSWCIHQNCLEITRRHLVVRQEKLAEKRLWIFPTKCVSSYLQGFLTCREILRHGTDGFTSPSEGSRATDSYSL
jgi:hypothetical protein